MSPWDEKHGCNLPGQIGTATHVGDPLTVEQIKALEPGTRIVVTWSGGNGPWEGVVADDPYYGVSYETRRGQVVGSLLTWPDRQHVPLNRVTLTAPAQPAAERPLRKPKAADISDELFLGTVLAVWEEEGSWTNTWHLAERIPAFPPKVVRAKAAQLIKRDMLTGCTCGCRGDFELAPRGLDHLAAEADDLTQLHLYAKNRAVKWPEQKEREES